MKASYVVSDENGYYDSQNIIAVFDKNLGQNVLSCVLHHSRNHEGGKGNVNVYWIFSRIDIFSTGCPKKMVSRLLF